MERNSIKRNELQLSTKGSFLVRDADLGNSDSDFIKFLKNEGFEWKSEKTRVIKSEFIN